MSEPARLSLIGARNHPSPFSPLAFPPDGRRAMGPPPPLGDDAFERGFAAGKAMADGQFHADRDALAKLVAAADALTPEPSDELAAMIATTVEHLVRELVVSAPIDSAWLAERIDRAVGAIDAADNARTLWLHPDDIDLLGTCRPDLDIRADASLERGALRIDCSAGWIEDGRSIHLDALRTALGLGERS